MKKDGGGGEEESRKKIDIEVRKEERGREAGRKE